MTIHKCPQCAEQYDETASFCSNCGIRFDSLSRCRECGELLADGMTACPECGCPVEDEQGSVSAQTAALFCEECGEPLSETDTVCGNCGAPVESFEQPVSAESAAVCLPTKTSIPADNTKPSEDTAAQNAVKRISVYNMLALLLTIPSTVLFSGQVFSLDTGIIRVSAFGFLDFSDAFQFVNNILNLLKGFGDDVLDIPRDFTAFWGYTNYIYYAFIIFVLYHFIKGLSNVNKGKLLDTVYFIPLILSGWCMFFSFVINSVILGPINQILDSTIGSLIKPLANIHGIISIGFERSFDFLIGIAVFDICAFVLIRTIEKKIAKAHGKEKEGV